MTISVRDHQARLLGSFLWAFTLGLGSACATTPHAAPVADVSPQHLWSPPLVYPPALRDSAVQGSVVLEGTVDEEGRVVPGSVRVLHASHPDFEAPAVAMLYGSRFRPARSEGRAMEALVRIPVQFHIQPAGSVTPADSITAADLMAHAQTLVRDGHVPEAMNAFARARGLDSRLAEAPSFWQPQCWCGSLWGYAGEVLGACEQLVSLDPDRLPSRDARGVARALVGDFAGAIADFQVVAERTRDGEQRAERLAWIADLQAGRNPLTPERQRALRSRPE